MRANIRDSRITEVLIYNIELLIYKTKLLLSRISGILQGLDRLFF